MIKKIFIASALLHFLIACSNDAQLSKEKYTDVILDLQVAETVINNSKIENKDSMRRVYQMRICDIYGFKDIESLKKALQPLEQNPQLMLDITKDMTKKLDQMADSVLSKPVNPPE